MARVLDEIIAQARAVEASGWDGLLAPITVKLLAPAPLESALVRLPNSQKIRFAKSSRALAAVIETRLETEPPPDPALGAETYSCLHGCG